MQYVTFLALTRSGPSSSFIPQKQDNMINVLCPCPQICSGVKLLGCLGLEDVLKSKRLSLYTALAFCTKLHEHYGAVLFVL